jgi:regulator-associated protein of mTOR
VSLHDLQDWLGSPCIYVWECSGAGNILTNFAKSAERKDAELRQNQASGGSASDLPGSAYADAIHLAACKANQILPMTPDLPADVFTCCLTSPIEIALRYFVLQDPLKRNVESMADPRSRITVDMAMKLPGDLKDRRTPLGELSWIFTAVTDTIAWLSFPREIFNRLFRQDLLVAALFRNFLLAQRIMTSYHCTPMSIPELPSTHNHPLWHSWDLAVDACLAQLPDLLQHEAARIPSMNNAPLPSIYKPSLFFAQHLQAFEVWLEHGGAIPRHISIRPKQTAGSPANRVPPEQLPIVLQVLLSQAHRLRALILLSRFVDLGPWAVHLSLSIGIFPYVQKLLQSPAIELKPVLIFIWARILAVDRTCQVDLLRDNGYTYFAQILAPYSQNATHLVIPNANEHRAMCAFILSALCRGFRQGQTACLTGNPHVFDSCLARLQEDDWLLKSWSLLCIAQMWADNDDAKKLFAGDQNRQSQMIEALRSTAVEVRAAALYAFGTLLGASATPIDSSDSQGGGGMGSQLSITEGRQLDLEAGLAYACMMTVKEDASPMVRKELVVVISCVAREWRGWFVCAAWVYIEEQAFATASENAGKAPQDVVGPSLEAWLGQQDDSAEEQSHDKPTLLSSFKFMFETLLDLSVDPNTEVALLASTVVDYVVALLLDSAFARVPSSATARLARKRPRPAKMATRQPSTTFSESGKFGQHVNGGAPPLTRTDTETTIGSSKSQSGMKRSSSVANALRSLASMTGFTSTSETDDRERANTPPAVAAEEPQYPSRSFSQYTSPYPDSTHPRTLPEHMSEAGTSLHSARARATSGLAMSSSSEEAADPLEVLQALTSEDMDRLRLRRNRNSEADADHEGRMNNNGLARPTDLTLGMVAKEVKDDVLPLKSGFYDWAVEYFREPQMKVSTVFST